MQKTSMAETEISQTFYTIYIKETLLEQAYFENISHTHKTKSPDIEEVDSQNHGKVI